MSLENFLVDLSRLGRGNTGVQLYAIDLARYLERSFDCRILTSRHLADCFSDPIVCEDPIVIRNSIVRRGRMSRALRALVRSAGTFVYCPYMQGFRGQPNQVITIHDLIAHVYPTRNPIERAYNRFILPSMARRARAVFTVSATARQDIATFYALPPERVHVVPNAVDSARWYPRDQPLSRGAPYLLVVSANRVYKNTTELLQRHHLWAREFRLKIVSTRARYGAVIRAAVREHGLEQRVDFLDDISEQELIDLYGGCAAVVYPSLMEGFGRPALEGMAMGRPVILSDIAVHKELFAEAAIFITPGDARSWERAFVELRADPASLQARIQRGLAIARRYSLEHSSRRLAEALLKVEPRLRMLQYERRFPDSPRPLRT